MKQETKPETKPEIKPEMKPKVLLREVEECILDIQKNASLLVYARQFHSKAIEQQIELVPLAYKIIIRSVQCGNIRRACRFYLILKDLQGKFSEINERARRFIEERIEAEAFDRKLDA